MEENRMRVLVIDVGGTHIKMLATGKRKPIEIPSGPDMTARKMVASVRKAAAEWKFEAVSVGYPGPVVHDHPVAEPHNLGRGWVGFDFPRERAWATMPMPLQEGSACGKRGPAAGCFQKVSGIRQSRRHESMNGSKPTALRAISGPRGTRQCGSHSDRHLSPHPGPLPRGEGESSAAFQHNPARCPPDEPPEESKLLPTVSG